MLGKNNELQLSMDEVVNGLQYYFDEKVFKPEAGVVVASIAQKKEPGNYCDMLPEFVVVLKQRTHPPIEAPVANGDANV